MDRKERPAGAQDSKYARQSELGEGDAPLLDRPASENPEEVADPRSVAASEVARPLGGVPRSKVTGRHDAGSGANETEDGLSSTEEAIRHAAEDIPTGGLEEKIEDVPVFDRADMLPKV